ncbi:hypothetical protein UL63_22615, partial [Shigella dysenteriae]
DAILFQEGVSVKLRLPHTFNFLYVILRGLYAFIVTDFIFCWAIALLLIFQHIKRQARTVVRAFF